MDVVIGLGGITVLPGGNVDRDGASFRRRMFVLYLDTQHAGGGRVPRRQGLVRNSRSRFVKQEKPCRFQKTIERRVLPESFEQAE